MNNLLPSVLLFFIISVIFCDGSDDTSDDYNYCDGFDDVDRLHCLDPSPDVIKQCVNDDSCGANNASFVGFYQYAVDDDDDDDNSSNTTTTIGSNNRGVQYAICATNSTGYIFNPGTIMAVEANSICKINEVTMALPEDSSEKCSDVLSTDDSFGSDCSDRCNHVIFKDWNDKAYKFELDDLAGVSESRVISGATTGIDGEEVCSCNFGNSTPIVGCVTRHTPDFTSDANSIFITSSFAAGVAVIVASATAIEMAFV